jgi:hypothetical protein
VGSVTVAVHAVALSIETVEAEQLKLVVGSTAVSENVSVLPA